ncbi:MAG TPA: CpsD/CapB family tyrosine-protein kinase [Symbiobacteriaceae bacterium]|nr:CpsD/CapB family tyrosine-protein kinase [Symbiobacteriaceae bacterium]
MNARARTISPVVITHHDPGAIASEAYRVLRTNLQFMGLDKPVKTILVTSATPTEGKTTTAINLAVAFAQTGAKVLLIDADLRRPTVAKVLGLDNWTGLTPALISQEGPENFVQVTGITGLTVLSSGPIPPNPAELLGSGRMERLLEHVAEAFDVVIIDTPPLLAVTDAAVLAPKVDGVLMVVRAGEVERAKVLRAKEALTAVKANLLGVVLTDVTTKDGEGYYYYYSSDGQGAVGRRT